MTKVSRVKTLRLSAVAIAICAAALCLAAAPPQDITSRDALWIIVDKECVADQQQSHDPKPCALVDLDDGVAKGFVVLKDVFGGEQFLLIPTARISGIESPAILAPDAPNYFGDAWDARKYLDEAVHRTLPREDVALAINSASSRSQDQLHIHVDCVRADVQAALRAQSNSIATRWAPVDLAFTGHHYWAMWAPGERLGANNPFRLLAKNLPGAAQNMGDRTLVVIGDSRSNGAAGFIILEDQVDREHQDYAHGEELLDHACRVAAPAAPPTSAPAKN